VVLKGLTTEKGRKVVFVVLISKVDGMKKNDDDELGIHCGGFRCPNTRKKTKMMNITHNLLS
jgi:hypothetical protein